MEPTYVTFEQAKWLKEKGFDIITRTAYDLKTYQPDNGGDAENLKIINNAKNYGDSTYTRFQRPEQWQVVEWLRVNHGIWINIWGYYSPLRKTNTFTAKIQFLRKEDTDSIDVLKYKDKDIYNALAHFSIIEHSSRLSNKVIANSISLLSSILPTERFPLLKNKLIKIILIFKYLI